MKEKIEILKQKRWIIAAWFSLVLISSYLKMGFLVGSENASLSLMVATFPVIAYFFPAYFSIPLVACAWFSTHLTWPVPLTLGIPTLMATLSWNFSQSENKGNDKLFHIILPVSCMALFYFSSVGADAWLYAAYWLIPIACCFLPLGILGRAIKSTFVAHAIGSIIWVYMVPMSPAAWLALIPVVAIERSFAIAWSLVMIGALSYAKAGVPKGTQVVTTSSAEGVFQR